MIRPALAVLALMVVPVSAGEEAAPLSARPLSSPASREWFTTPPARIDVGPPRQVRTERLDATNQPALTSEEAALVRLYVGASSTLTPASAEGLAAGEEVPDDVGLRPLPADLVARVPRLGARAYVVAGDTIGIVDPESRRIGQVLRP